MALLSRVATRRLGVSEKAIEEIAGSGWRKNPTNAVLLCGFDFSQYKGAGNRAKCLRRAFGLADGAPVVGHVGRFEVVKNHAFLVDAFAWLLQLEPRAQLVLVGDGPTKQQILVRTVELGLIDQVHFAGTTDDVPAYMAMFDVLALPSFREGFGIVCIEAQAAGTPVIASEAVPPEVSVVPDAVQHLPLEAGARAWAEAFKQCLDRPLRDPACSLADVEGSRFSISRCIDELDHIYQLDLNLATRWDPLP